MIKDALLESEYFWSHQKCQCCKLLGGCVLLLQSCLRQLLMVVDVITNSFSLFSFFAWNSHWLNAIISCLSRNWLCHLYHRSLRSLLLQHHHGLGFLLPHLLLHGGAALDQLHESLEHRKLHQLLQQGQCQLVPALHLSCRRILYVSACKWGWWW